MAKSGKGQSAGTAGAKSAAKDAGKELARLEKRLHKARDVEAKRKKQASEARAEVVQLTAQGRGALGYYIVSDGTPRPYRVKISVGSFRNMLALPHLLVGAKLADMPSIYWALNYWPVEADR